MNAAKENGLRIPEDVEILSLIGTRYAKILRPRVSNMFLNMNEVGETAMNMLRDMLNGETYPRRIKIETEFVRLDTTIN